MEAMTDKYPDYQEMETKFIELANKDEYLAKKFRASANPALFAYESAKTHVKNLSFNDPNYEQDLKERLKKEILAELVNNQNPKKNSNPVNTLPSLNNATATKGSGMVSSDDLFSDSIF